MDFVIQIGVCVNRQLLLPNYSTYIVLRDGHKYKIISEQ